VGNFLCSLGHVSVSGKPLLHGVSSLGIWFLGACILFRNYKYGAFSGVELLFESAAAEEIFALS
jgi:hypothetical protein